MQIPEKTDDDQRDYRLLSRQTIPIVIEVLKLITQKLTLESAQKLESLLDKISSKSPTSPFNKEEKALREALQGALLTSPNRVDLIRLLPVEPMLVPLVRSMLVEEADHSLTDLMPLFGALLQCTNTFNFSIMCKVRQLRDQSHQMVRQMLERRDIEIATALVRGFDAQPYLVELIDMVPLFASDVAEAMSDESDGSFDQLVYHLREFVYPALERGENIESKEERSARLELVQSLLLNKRREARLVSELQEQLEDNTIALTTIQNDVSQADAVATVLDDGTLVAKTPYINAKVNAILQEIEEKPFGHFVIRGPSGSGKMTLLRLVDHMMATSLAVCKSGEEAARPSNRFIVVTLEETFDSKNLVGTYVCNETGEFVFKKGPLTVAAEQGLWLVLRNIEDTPSDLLSFLLPLVQQNTLQVTSTFSIKPKLGFRIFALTKTQESQQFFSTQEETIQPLLSLLKQTSIESLMPEANREDLESILKVKFAHLFRPLQIGVSVHAILQAAIAFIQGRFSQLKLHLLDYKPASVTQMFSLYERVVLGLNDHLASQEEGDLAFLSQSQRQLIIEEIHDVYLAYMYDKDAKRALIRGLISEVFNTSEESTLDSQIIAEYIADLGRNHGKSDQSCFFGRASLSRTFSDGQSENDGHPANQTTSRFVYTGATVRSLEQICQSVRMNEAMLLVGETGTGKTTIVQELAKVMGKTLHVFNMNQNTDSADLLGGFKSVDLKYLLTPVYRLFLEVFSGLLNTQAQNNAKFLSLMQKTFEQNQVKEFIQCLNHGLKSIKRSKNRTDEHAEQIALLERQTSDLQKRAKKLVSGGGFIFQFVEGTLIKSIQEGDWILLDEINLASDSVLNKLATIVQGSHILLNERADIVETKRHKDFRIFMCMNPPYSSAGKKQLPISLRSKLTEVYVSELENEADLWDIIDRNTKSLSNENVSAVSEGQKRQILSFYKQVRAEVQKQMRRGNIGLRNLCRALFFIKRAVQLRYPAVKAIYDSLLTCFASHLDKQLQESIRSMIMALFEIKKLPELTFTEEAKDDRYVYIQGNVIPKGAHPPANFDAKNFILTPSFKGLLKQLASVVAVSNFAVILEGPTSAGKTSCVQYLAQVTHNKVIRINNHMHTDVQEYLGSYVPDSETGKLVFQEGVLVEAVRHGYWVILDELNLAPSEVLEALNRLLDDNRELHIVETQKVIKAHPGFRIFATQNPTEGYGGRKELSEAFKNRFVLIRVLDVPTEELKEILVQKCSMPASRAALMIRVMESLQIYRSQANLFSGKNAIITVRDLLKWAGRVNLNSERGNHMDPKAIAMEGFFVLGERSRNSADKQFIQATIEKVFNVKLDIEELYETYFTENLESIFDRVPAELNLPKIIPSKQLKRLAVLVEKCLRNREPVLLVGETGCGKTTLCQVFASEVTKQSLMQINCHQNTETSDFIGCMRTRKNLKQTQDKLEELLDEIARDHLDQAGKDLYSRAKSLKKRQKVVLGQLKNENHADLVKEIKALAEDLNSVFEWHDGILVEAMEQGGLLLIDEISLANDSVLERLNSVFEQDRVLMVTEKSSQEAIKIVAHEKFNMVATMNPSGDFGKKELSPALRNRMTEIWVESYFQQGELIEHLNQVEAAGVVAKQVPESIDLFLIISKLVEDTKCVPRDQTEAVALAIFAMVSFLASFGLSNSTKFQALKRKSLSIRDILCIIDFIAKNLAKMTLVECFKEAIELVVIDGICLGIDTTGQQEQEAIIKVCNDQLDRIVSTLFTQSGDGMTSTELMQLVNTPQMLGVSHYSIAKKQELALPSTFAFNAETTQTNLLKLLRALTLAKPILIEGPPGVGKTALVEQVAKVTGRRLVRVNLSEQTDMMDLLGSEYPTSANSNKAGQGDIDDVSDEEDQDEIQFRWGDGVLLSAIKEGHWLLIDEMNLAQQSILEGLNAVLDHRRTVYIPELNREFQCHPDFFVFACQNPSQSASSTTGRKTLPKSFLNRFTKIYLNELTNEDYRVILRSISDENIFKTQDEIDWLLALTIKIERICASQSNLDSAVNMRDLSRFLRVYKQALQSQQASGLQAILYAFQCTYLLKEGVTDAKRKQCLNLIQESFRSMQSADGHESEIQELPQTSSVRIDADSGLTFDGILTSKVSFGATTSSDVEPIEIQMADLLSFKGPQAAKIQGLNDCLRVNLPILLTTNDTSKAIKVLNLMAGVRKAQVRRILLSDRSDTTQLLGCFEQTSQDLSQILRLLQPFKKQLFYTASIMELEGQLSEGPLDLQAQVKLVDSFLRRHTPIFDHLKPLVKICKRGVSRFEWVDSVLVKAITDGEWAVFENANICNPSILDRLNPLLEEGNQSMVINEQGLDDSTQTLRTVIAHNDFRAIFVLSQKSLIEQGKDVSRALRNRCVELSITFDHQDLDGNVELEELACQKLDARNLDWSLSSMQTQFDLIPAQASSEEEHQAQEVRVALGKRKRQELSSLEITATVAANDDAQLQGNKAYPFIFIEQAPQMAGSEPAAQQIRANLEISDGDGTNGWQLYLRHLISELQAKLKLRLSREIVTKHLEPFFSHLLGGTAVSDCCLEDGGDLDTVHFLLATLLKSGGLSSALENALSVYLASKLRSETIRSVLCSSSDGLASELSFLFDARKGYDLEALRALDPNVVPSQALNRYLERGLQLQTILNDQKVFMFKVSAARLNQLLETPNSDVANGGRVALTMRMLRGDLDDEPRQATVILLNAEKEIMSTEEMVKQLEDLDDPATVLETPNLVVVPFDATSKSVQGVVTSQSFIYESLCDLKDWIRVQLGKVEQARHFRTTRLPLAGHLYHQSQASAVLAAQIAQMARPLQERESEFSFEDRLIQAVLVDEQSICLRDLPAFYACATSLLYKLDEVGSLRGQQEQKFASLFRDNHSKVTVTAQLREELSALDTVLETQVDQAISQITTAVGNESDYASLISLAKESKVGILESLELVWSVKTEEVIHALIVLPLEISRLDNSLRFANQRTKSYAEFFRYHLRCAKESERLTSTQRGQETNLSDHMRKLELLQSDSGSRLSERQQNQLRPLLAFTRNLLGEVRQVQSLLSAMTASVSHFKDIRERCETIVGLVNSATLILLPMFNNIIGDLFSGCLNLVVNTRQLCLALESMAQKAVPTKSLSWNVINLLAPVQTDHRQVSTSMLHEMIRVTQKQQKNSELNERSLLWGLKLSRLQPGLEAKQRTLSLIFDFFIRREVAKKLAEERAQNEKGEQLYEIPFKMKDQALPDFVGKAMDEWTKEDVARMEAEAEKEIETNFPSYFDEVQRQFFSGELSKDYGSRDAFGKYQRTSVAIETIFAEIVGVTKPAEATYLLEFLRERVEVVKLSLQEDKFERIKRLYSLDTLTTLPSQPIAQLPLWQEDVGTFLRKTLSSSKPRQLMNVAEVTLARSYNFYHDPFPEEARIVYEPMQNLLIRLRDIVIRDEYESPLLNESIFLANYIITCFNSEGTPLMKLLTSMEFLLTKLEEWENTYASKRLNSVETEINTIKMLIIRFRKIQILSWRNLLSWKKDKMIRDDVMECCRLAHTLERQVFDLKLYPKPGAKTGYARKVLIKHKSDTKGRKLKTDQSVVQERSVLVKAGDNDKEVESKVFELLDLFIRDSSLGVYQSRLVFVDFLKKHFAYKLEKQCARQPDFVKERLAKVINILEFVYNYYAQFEEKLQQTVERLDAAARTKVKTLIDVSKWTVQKFTQVKNNIDKTHRQLNKACKEEEEALLQNVQSLVIASSRKKYAANQDQLLSLHNDHSVTSTQNPQLQLQQWTSPLAKQLAFLTQNTLTALLPNEHCLSEATDGFMERLSEVRAINKKHIQVRAYYDLLRFMKGQGLKQSSFNSSELIQRTLIEQELADVVTFRKASFFRAYETYSMLQSAAQVDENSHIKNAEVMRMQAFSRSLMLAILTLNKSLVDCKGAVKSLGDIKTITKTSMSQTEEINDDSHLTEAYLVHVKGVQKSMVTLIADTKDRVNLLSLQDTNELVDVDGKATSHLSIVAKLEKCLTDLEHLNVLDQGCLPRLEQLLTAFEKSITLEIPAKHMRLRLITQQALVQAAQIRTNGLQKQIEVDSSEQSQNQFSKLVKQTENLVKLCMQKLVTSLKALEEQQEAGDQRSQRKLSNTADNSVNNNPELAGTTPINNDQTLESRKETSVDEMQAYAKVLQGVLQDEMTAKMLLKIKQVFALRGVERLSPETRASLENIYDVVSQLGLSLNEAISRVDVFLRSMMKFSFLSQRVFIHLIYQGFCGQEDKDDPEEEPPSDLEEDGEMDGCGLGDGKGGKENITDQIEHEEQLEGLKNYESEEEQQDQDDQQDRDQGNDDEEEDNDFEMKNDFDGDMDDEPEEQKQDEKKEDDDDDELDKVDDMLDNQLWDQNMEDMEQKEKEEQEKDEQKEKDKEEVDLGDRDLDDQHLLPQNKDDQDMAEGDRNEQEQADQKPEDDDQQMEKEDEAAADSDEENEGERDNSEDDQEDKNEEIPLDKNSVLAEEDEKIEEDAKSNEDGQESERDDNAEKEDTDEVDSKFSEQDAQSQEDGSQQDEQMDGEDEEDADVQQKADQAILDDDQIQAQEDKEDQEKDEKDKEQANLKRQDQQNQNQQPENKQNQATDENQVSQADQSGSDLLFEMSKQFQKRQEQKKEQKQQQERQQQKEDKSKAQVEQPQMVPDDLKDDKDQRRPDDQEMDDNAAEYMFDDNQAENIQGKLATDKVDEDEPESKKDEVREEGADGELPEDMPMDEEKSESGDNDADELAEENIEKTQAQLKETGKLKPEAKEKQEKDEEDKQDDEEAKDFENSSDPRDLMDEYEAYLKASKETKMEVDESDEDDKKDNMKNAVARFTMNMEQFDYMDQKAWIRQRFQEWLSDEREHTQALSLLAKFKNQTQAVSSSLCEQLRIVLEPQLSQNLQGDFKTGKRLNMKKVISFIASHYRNDKIWLRRTLPSKRDYKILIAIDDSMSMRESNQGFFSLEAMIALTEALNRLEVGKVAVGRIRDRMDLVQSFDDTYTSEKAGFIVSQFRFEHQAPTSADYAMANFVCDANKLLDMQNGGNTQAVNCPFVIVLSDGRFNKDNVRRYMNEAREKRYLYIFVILDKQATTTTIQAGSKPQPKAQSILNMRSAVKTEGSRSVKLVPYLKDFPFDYYCIVSDTSELPNALGTILVQWFSMVSAAGGPR